MPVFLSPEWLVALDAAARASAALTEIANQDVCRLEQVVRDVPGRGEVRYHLEVQAGNVRVAGGGTRDPDLRLTTDYATAVALARGETNAQRALAAGRLRIGGDLELLATRASVLAGLGDVFARVRADTDFPA